MASMRTSTTSSAFTAGAVPVKNAKGEVSMQKVKVTRYVAGKRPEYAPLDESSDEEEDEAEEEQQRLEHDNHQRDDGTNEFHSADINKSHHDDPDNQNSLSIEDDADKQRRLARLLKSRESSSGSDDDDDDDEEKTQTVGRRYERPNAGTVSASRQIAKPEIVSSSPNKEQRQRLIGTAQVLPADASQNDDSNDDDDADDERERLRRMLRRKVDAQRVEAAAATAATTAAPGKSNNNVDSFKLAYLSLELKRAGGVSLNSSSRLPNEIKKLDDDSDADDADEDDEESDDDEEEEEEDITRPRLKPVFVRRKDRVTRQEEQQAEKRKEQEAKRLEEERKQEARRLVEKAVKLDIEQEQERTNKNAAYRLDAAVPELPVIEDNADEEIEYEAWRVRELGRIKRDRDEREKWRVEQAEMEKLREMSAEEREKELANRKKEFTNPTVKGKMRFLQRYYHRGVFYLDKDDKVFQRDVTAPTLEDQFDKAVMPRVLQVKNFGKSGRSKWTHLAAEDTSGQRDNTTGTWTTDTSRTNARFSTSEQHQMGGSRQQQQQQASDRPNKRQRN